MCSKTFPTKWKKVLYKTLAIYDRLNCDMFDYRDGHKLYKAHSKELEALYNKEKKQYKMWKILND